MRPEQRDDQIGDGGEVAGAWQWLPTAGMAAKCRGVGVAPEFGDARDGVDAVFFSVGAASTMDLDQQMLAVGLYAGVWVTGERGELALELSGLSLREGRWHGV